MKKKMLNPQNSCNESKELIIIIFAESNPEKTTNQKLNDFKPFLCHHVS